VFSFNKGRKSRPGFYFSSLKLLTHFRKLFLIPDLYCNKISINGAGGIATAQQK
jgi:hypothetical protein